MTKIALCFLLFVTVVSAVYFLFLLLPKKIIYLFIYSQNCDIINLFWVILIFKLSISMTKIALCFLLFLPLLVLVRFIFYSCCCQKKIKNLIKHNNDYY